MPFTKGNTHGRKFEKGLSGNPEGRPIESWRGYVSQLAREAQVSNTEIRAVFKILMHLPKSKLKELLQEPTLTIMEEIVIKGLLSDAQDFVMENLEKLLQWLMTRPKQEIDVSVDVTINRQEIDLGDGNKLII